MKTMYFLGIDGGASKTAAVLCDQRGCVLARCRKGGCVVRAQPTAESLAVLGEAVQEVLAAASLPAGAEWRCGIGISGIDFADHIPGQIETLGRTLNLPAERLTVVNDGIVALWGASAAARAGVIQHGSGLTSALRREPGQERIYDCLDVAALCDLRQEAVALVARMIDGRCPPSPLKDQLLRHWHVPRAEEFAEMVYRGMIPWQRLWSSLPTLFGCWLDGDAAAGALVRKAAADYARMARAILDAIGGEAEIALGGGVPQQAPPRFWHLLEAQFRLDAPGAKLRRPALAPEEGAAVMACHRAGLDAGALFAALESQRRV